jgi:hypothetical protein
MMSASALRVIGSFSMRLNLRSDPLNHWQPCANPFDCIPGVHPCQILPRMRPGFAGARVAALSIPAFLCYNIDVSDPFH